MLVETALPIPELAATPSSEVPALLLAAVVLLHATQTVILLAVTNAAALPVAIRLATAEIDTVGPVRSLVQMDAIVLHTTSTLVVFVRITNAEPRPLAVAMLAVPVLDAMYDPPSMGPQRDETLLHPM